MIPLDRTPFASHTLFLLFTLMLGCETVDPYENDARGACYQIGEAGWSGDIHENGQCEDDVSEVDCEQDEYNEGVSTTFYEDMSCEEAGH